MTATKLGARRPVFCAVGRTVYAGTWESSSDKHGVKVRLDGGGVLYVPFHLCFATESAALRSCARRLRDAADELEARAKVLESGL